MRLTHLLNQQRGFLFPWSPVFFGTGIAIYFALRFEPGREIWWIVVVAMAAVLTLGWMKAEIRLYATASLLLLAGFSIAGIRAHQVAEEKLGFRYYGPIEGRIVAIDRSNSDALRLTLDRVVLKNLGPKQTPAKVRVSLHGKQGFFTPEPGLTVILTGHLSPPGGPVEPGGFDFQRHAWFQRIGAVGYTRTPVLVLTAHEGGDFWLGVYRLRRQIASAVQSQMSVRAGAFAAAITTGDRSGIEKNVLETLRASNLAHLLAISGLHMGLLTGFVFALVRLALVVWGAQAKKLAAIAALFAGAFYLLLSGGNVATERAFIMVAVMLLAVLLDRRAINLRAVALAALIVLTLRPEAIYGPGFQMSFAATTALVVVYGSLRARDWSNSRWPRWLRYVGGVALSSLVAGMATAPIAAAHFNQVPHYGLLANMLSVPVMGLVIMPAAVLAALLAPFGLEGVALAVMEPAILWILVVAENISDWPGALSFTVTPGPLVLPLVVLGALFLALWQGPVRTLGLPIMLLGFVLWLGTERPYLLVSQSGGLVGVMTDQGRALSKSTGESFAAESWLENDGDPVSQNEASERAGFSVGGKIRVLKLGEGNILHATGKTAAQLALDQCKGADILIVNVSLDAEDCTLIDARSLKLSGALAVNYDGKSPAQIIGALHQTGRRLWSED